MTKWCANHCKLLGGIPDSDIEKEFPLSEDGEKTVKTLGICGAPGRMHFIFICISSLQMQKPKEKSYRP